MHFNSDFESVRILSVTLCADSKITLCAQNKYFEIAYSAGLFDLTLSVGTTLYFTKNMKIKTEPVEGSQNLSSLSIQNMELNEQVMFQDHFEHVKLRNVTMKDSSCIVLNKMCKRLVIENFSGSIDVKNLACLEEVEIRFSMEETADINIIGSVRVDNLCFKNVCRSVNMVQSMLSSFIYIRNLKFESEFIYNSGLTAEAYVNIMKLIPGYENASKKYASFLSSEYPQRCSRQEILFYETANAAVNYILGHILNTLKAATIQKIELASVALSATNYGSLKALNNLQILDIGTKKFSGALFNCLPPNLRLLNISEPSKHIMNENTSYNIADLRRMTRCCNLKVLIINADLVFETCTLSFLPSSVKVLKIYFESMPEEIPQIRDQIAHIRELYIEGNGNLFEDRYCTVMHKTKAAPFVKMLSKCIKFKSLEHFAFISSYVLVEIDPNTLEFTKARHGKSFERVGPIYDEVDACFRV
ncbi:hypothetical protein VCUG_01200 [Vavraia culicis subsp. floridensis]|uniref:LRR containing protein n=1 Tax=Vavraia culicis (isolate floridensis) TaxID=948595 RepID=L2GUH1_VAVCU|nr:uncharacterized protein VCUG_01200 [Vavraia culicis subsp. floridensis]ELA47316.1 hypothetical protein VCUG_01200 [Vavraia culicis subsp. floridensis]